MVVRSIERFRRPHERTHSSGSSPRHLLPNDRSSACASKAATLYSYCEQRASEPAGRQLISDALDDYRARQILTRGIMAGWT